MSLLEASGVCKRFAGITALDDVSLSVEPGEPVGLIGPNGAGKTTFFNCLLGISRSDGGRVVFNGRDISRMPVYKRARLGTGRFWKDVLNLAGPTRDEGRRVDHTLELLGLNDVADKPIESLSLGRARLVEMGRALMTEPLLLLLDEPSSGLDQSETMDLVGTLQEVQRERGTAILLVEHDVEMVQAFASRLYVLDFGIVIATGATADVMTDEAVRKAYLGELV